MQLPIVAPALIVSAHAQAFRHLFNDVRQFEHFQNYLTGLIVLENKSLANISRCILESADKTNLSRFLSESPWQPQVVNRFRIQYVLTQTVAIRPTAPAGYLIFDDTLCEHVGSLFEYVERHYDHCDGTYPLAHNLVTSHYLSGAVRLPIETFYRDSKQLLGLDEYRTRTYAANEAHWCLVFVAYSLLHLGCLPPPSSKGKGKPPTTPSKTIGEVCRQQAQAVIEDLLLFAHNLLQQGCSATQLWCKLFGKQNKEVLV